MSVFFDEQISDIEPPAIPKFFKDTGKYTLDDVKSSGLFKGHPLLGQDSTFLVENVLMFPYKSKDQYRFLGDAFCIGGDH